MNHIALVIPTLERLPPQSARSSRSPKECAPADGESAWSRSPARAQRPPPN